MRRLPIYFLVDVSESMVGAPIEEVQNGMRTIIQNLRTDPYALETVYVSIIVFAGKAKVLSPLTELYKFYPPIFPIGGGTSLGKGMECLMNAIDKDVKKTTLEEKGDWKPIIFLFTDGNPTDDYYNAFKRWNDHYRKHCNLIAISIGDNVNVLTIAQITDNILLLKDTDPSSFNQFFKWVTASIKSTSVSVSEQYSDDLKLAPTDGINLEKVDKNKIVDSGTVDDNFAVLHARCQTTKGDYLIKYARRFAGETNEFGFQKTGFRLVGSYPIDKNSYQDLSTNKFSKINTNEIVGAPVCPCCGNQLGAVLCECGNLFCADTSGSLQCPWCGMEGFLGEGISDGRNITRGLG